jgi:hypothetical protein
MLASNPELSEPMGLPRNPIIRPIIRNGLALRRLLGPVVYPASIGVIAIWVIGVFFGLGFYHLPHRHSEDETSRLGVGSADLSPASPEGSPRPFRSLASPDQPFRQLSEVELGELTVAAPDKKSAIDRDRQVVARSKPGDPAVTELMSYPPSTNRGISAPVYGEFSLFSPPPNQLSDAVSPQSTAPTLQSAAPLKIHRARPTKSQTAQPQLVRRTSQARLRQHCPTGTRPIASNDPHLAAHCNSDGHSFRSRSM